MTQDQAYNFVTDLLDNCVPKGQVERVAEFYAEDVIGHYRDGQFNFSDLKQRIALLGENILTHQLEIIDIMVFDNFLFVVSNQSWQMKSDKKWHEVHMSVVYRLREMRIAELWVVWDANTPSFTEVNSNFLSAFKHVEVEQKKFAEFQRLLTNPMQAEVELTERQQWYLFYYLKGLSSKEIANIVHRSYRTVEDHLNIIKELYGVSTRAELRKKFSTND